VPGVSHFREAKQDHLMEHTDSRFYAVNPPVSRPSACPDGHVARAKDLYISPWFRMARHFAEQNASRWFILSSALGLLRPDELVAPYDSTLNRMGMREKQTWSRIPRPDSSYRWSATHRMQSIAPGSSPAS
jgi:hypothetical protein